MSVVAGARRVETIDDCTLILGDCREVLPGIGKVDAVVTDPPYGIEHASNHGASWAGKQIPGDGNTDTRDWVVKWASALPSVFFGTWKTPPVGAARGCVVWDKGPAFGMGDLTFPWKPSFELAYVCGDGWCGNRRAEGVLRGAVVVSWESHGRQHPHQKPVWLITHFLDRLPNAETILDPFMGSGTTGVARVQLGRKFIGIEIVEEYFDIACRRVAEAVAQPRLALPEPQRGAVQEAML